jgi:regulatory protein
VDSRKLLSTFFGASLPFKRSTRTYDEPALYEYAVGALSRRMRSVAELKRLMRQRKIEGEADQIIESVINRLKDQKYLNDTHYATMYATYRRDGQKLGRQRVVTDLKLKGVHADVIEKTVGVAYSEISEEKLARDYLNRKRLKQPTSQKESARIFRALARAGFRSATIFKVLKSWKVDEELLTALDEEASEAGAAGESREKNED